MSSCPARSAGERSATSAAAQLSGAAAVPGDERWLGAGVDVVDADDVAAGAVELKVRASADGPLEAPGAEQAAATSEMVAMVTAEPTCRARQPMWIRRRRGAVTEAGRAKGIDRPYPGRVRRPESPRCGDATVQG
jgi:hypothetical protein